MVKIAHISDFHCSRTHPSGKIGFKPARLASCINEVNRLKPDAVVVTGDLTMFGFREEYALAKRYISNIRADTLIIPGNHDARYCGYEYFEEYFGYGNRSLDLPGINIIGIDTTVPDMDSGNIGRGKLRWLTDELSKKPKGNCRIVAMHHHLVPVPRTGRERSTISDAGTVLEALVKSGVDMVLCGHKHTPYSWIVNNMAIVNAGSASAVKLRANTNNSYNVINFEKGIISIFMKEIGKRQRLIASYKTAISEKELIVKKNYKKRK